MEPMCVFVCSFAWILLLTASSTTAEKAMWLVRYDKKEKKFEINENALSKLELLPKPVKVISAIGEARIGKSTTLNFVRHIWDCNGKHEAKIEEVFETGDTAKAVTYGIWMSVCEEENIVLLDVEGTNLGNDAVTSHMSVFTYLMSSGIVVFSPETIKNDILDFLYKVTRLSEHIFRGIDETNNFGHTHLHIVIRDALSSASEETFVDTMRNAIVEPSGEDKTTDNKRRAIAKYFRKESIAVSEIPLIKRKLLKDSEIKKNVEYWDAILFLSQSFKKFPAKTTLRRNDVDGNALVKTAKILIKMMNKNSWSNFSDTYLMVEKYLCDKSFQIVVSPALELTTVHEIEERKESVLKKFRDGCALKEEVNKADILLETLISSIKRRGGGGDGFIPGFFTGAALLALSFALFSDARLKENVITLTPSKYEALGVREVSWTWNKQAEKIGLRGESRGVIAQEVEKLYPWAVVTGNDGYKRVLYKALDYAVDSLKQKEKRIEKPANK